MPDFDMNTVLAGFLKDLQAGTLGPTWPITAVRVGDGSAGAPSYSFASQTGTGFRWANPGIYATSAGTDYVYFSANGVRLGSGGAFEFSSSSGPGSAADASLSRGALGVVTVGANQSYGFGSAPLFTRTAPTVTSAGTSPSIVSSNGTAAFVVNVGTGGTATTIVLAMPAATTGWMAFVENVTATAANRANQRVVVQSSTTTSLTLQNQTISTGAALAFTASDLVRVIAIAY